MNFSQRFAVLLVVVVSVLLATTGYGQLIDTSTKEGIGGLAFSPDGKMLLASDSAGVVSVIDVTTKKEIHSFKTGQEWAKDPTFLSDGKSVAIANPDGTIDVRNTKDWSTISTWKVHTDWVIGLELSRTKKTLFSVSRDLQVCGVDAVSGKLRYKFSGHSEWVESLAESPDGELLVTGDWGGMIHVWDIKNEKSIKSNQAFGNIDAVKCLAFSPDGKLLVAAGQGGVIKIWDVTKWELVQKIVDPDNDVTSIIPWSDNSTFIFGGQNGSIVIVNGITGKRRKEIGVHDTKWVLKMALSPDAKTLASGDLDGHVKLWDLSKFTELHPDLPAK